jgi:hypothetical protein
MEFSDMTEIQQMMDLKGPQKLVDTDLVATYA